MTESIRELAWTIPYLQIGLSSHLIECNQHYNITKVISPTSFVNIFTYNDIY